LASVTGNDLLIRISNQGSNIAIEHGTNMSHELRVTERRGFPREFVASRRPDFGPAGRLQT
jgi:hypothetical protein